MFSEHRVVLIIILSFSIYGLSSLLSLGDFVTPFFFSKLIYVGVSLLFLLMNLRIVQRGYLVFAFLAMISIAIGDGFTVHILTRGGERIALTNFFNNEVVLYLSFIIFVGFYVTSIFLLRKIVKKIGVLYLLFITFLAGLIFAYLKEVVYFELAFALFFIIYYVIVRRSEVSEKSIINIFAALFLLQFFLELFKYLF